MPWTVTPPLSDGWDAAAEFNRIILRYNTSSPLSYAAAGLSTYESTGTAVGWTKELEELKPWV